MGRKLDLRTGSPVWMAYRAPRVPVTPLKRDVTCDVAVVGLGISGAMIAEALTARGLAVICVDRRGAIRGSTPATTALVQFELDEPLTSLTAKIGKSGAGQAWRRSRLAVTNLKGRIEDLEIACDMHSRPSLYLAGNVLGPGQLREEADARQGVGIAAHYLTRGMLMERFGIDRPGAILSHENLAVDPRKLTAGLLTKALERNARFYAPTEVTAIEERSGEVVLSTRQGPSVTAEHAVLATGYELLDVVPSATHTVVSTYAIATAPQKRALWPQEAMIWEASDPYLYLRTTSDGRVICGGEDEPFAQEEARDRLLPDKARRLSEKLRALFPDIDATPQFAWTGYFGSTTTGLPYLGRLPGRERVFAVQGYGGNGITFSQIASELVATTIAGGKDHDADVFSFSRTNWLRQLADLSGKLIP